jgi:hypothetical protein
LVVSSVVQSALRQFAGALDAAIHHSLNREGDIRQEVYFRHGCIASSLTSQVLDVVVEHKLRFYGYCEETEPFLKIILLNPMMVKRAADLLFEVLIAVVSALPELIGAGGSHAHVLPAP